MVNFLEKLGLTEKNLVVGLRLSLGAIFFWFGALKVAGHNPVFEIVNSTFPFLANGTGNTILGAVEVIIGLGLFSNVFPVITTFVLLAHLAGTFLTFALAPEMMFAPHFPILTLAGEFVFKNAVLAMAGLVVLMDKNK